MDWFLYDNSLRVMKGLILEAKFVGDPLGIVATYRVNLINSLKFV